MAGYDLVMKYGATNEDICKNSSASFEEGCLKGIEDVLDNLRDDFLDELERPIYDGY